MTFLVTVYTHEAIVMAADSRTTFNNTAHYSDTAQKLFLTKSGIGISFCGAADINGHLIQEYIESFCESNNSETVSSAVIEFNKMCQGVGIGPQSIFYFAGYDIDKSSKKQVVMKYIPTQDSVIINDAPGAAWDGQTDIISRLFTPVFVKRIDDKGKEIFIPHPGFQTNFDLFTVQDAIDFAMTSMEIVKGMLRLQNRQVNVGGPVDMLLITPKEAKWLAKKKLHT